LVIICVALADLELVIEFNWPGVSITELVFVVVVVGVLSHSKKRRLKENLELFWAQRDILVVLRFAL
jgi:hypothetical protein